MYPIFTNDRRYSTSERGCCVDDSIITILICRWLDIFFVQTNCRVVGFGILPLSILTRVLTLFPSHLLLLFIGHLGSTSPLPQVPFFPRSLGII